MDLVRPLLDSVAPEAELRAKLQHGQEARERAPKEREAWGTPPVWFREEEWCKEQHTHQEERMAASRSSASPIPSQRVGSDSSALDT